MSARPFLAVVVVGLVATAACSADKAPAPSPAVPREEPAASYAVNYRVEEQGRARDEAVVVRRPYESRRLSTGDGATTGTLVNDDGLWQWAADETGHGGGWRLVDPGRRRGEADERPLGALAVLVKAGKAARSADGVVLGRPCTGFRVREPIGAVVAGSPTERDHVEMCIDATGVVLRERWVANDRLLRAREAVAFTLDPVIGPEEFRAEPKAGSGDGRALSGRVLFPFDEKVASGLESRFDLPPSITAEGAVALLALDAQRQPTGGTVFRFFRSGTDLIDVEEVETDPVRDRRGIPHDVPVGEAAVETDLRTVALRVVLGTGTTVVVRAPRLDLVDALAASMSTG